MLVYLHPPLDARIFYKEALSLKRAGHEVTILVPLFEQKLKDHDIDLQLDKNDETIVQGIRFKAIRLRKTKIPLLGYLVEISRYKKAVLKHVPELKADIYHCQEHKIPLYTLLALIKMSHKKKLKAKYIFDVHEYYPGYNRDKYQNPLKYFFFSNWMRWMDKQAVQLIDHFIVVSEASRIYYLSLNRYIKIDKITNVASKKIFNFDESKIKKGTQFTLCHEGNLKFDRGLKDIVKILAMMKEHQSPVHLKIIGDIPEKENQWLKAQIDKHQLGDYIHFTGWVAYPQVGTEIRDCHVGLVTMKPSYNNIFSVSNKFFNYLLYGLPVIAIRSPEMSRIIEENNCGMTYHFDDFDALYDCIFTLYTDQTLYQQLSKNALRCSERYFNWAIAEKKLIDIYEKLSHS